jgi:hypothetical protein
MKGKTLLIFLLMTGFLCCCDKEEQLGEFLLGNYKSCNPFNGDETLIYKSDIGDSIIFFGNGRYSELFHYKPTNNPTNDYWVNERNNCGFSTEDKHYTLRINMSTHSSSSVEMYLQYVEQVKVDTFYGIGPTYPLPLSIEVFNHPSPYQDKFYLDSLQVFNILYKEVFADSALLGGFLYSQSHLTPDVRPTTFYYTVSEGIIRIDFDDDSFWGLTEILLP